MVILGLLDVVEGDISKEAEYIWNNYVQAGERFSAGVERYLLEIGISQSDIDTFRSLMLADAPAN